MAAWAEGVGRKDEAGLRAFNPHAPTVDREQVRLLRRTVLFEERHDVLSRDELPLQRDERILVLAVHEQSAPAAPLPQVPGVALDTALCAELDVELVCRAHLFEDAVDHAIRAELRKHLALPEREPLLVLRRCQNHVLRVLEAPRRPLAGSTLGKQRIVRYEPPGAPRAHIAGPAVLAAAHGPTRHSPAR